MEALIKKLTEAWGPSGYEHHVREIIRAEVADIADEITVDPLGNLICKVGGEKGAKVLFAAHMDEIGVMATFQEPSTGYLRMSPIGGIQTTGLTGSRVLFENGTTGVISPPDLFGKGWNTAAKLDECFIDVSDGSEQNPVQPGSPAAFWRPFEKRGTRLIAKSMDDRVACAIAIEAMRKLKAQGRKKYPNRVYFAFTVQEEVGCRGATTAAYAINPDVAVALDVTSTGDTIHGERMIVKLGGGAAIKVMDRGTIVPPAVRQWMVEHAEADNIPYQLEMLNVGGTDAGMMQLARSGVPSGCVSIPCRYVHTTSETVDIRDVEACVNLVTSLASHPAPFGG